MKTLINLFAMLLIVNQNASAQENDLNFNKKLVTEFVREVLLEGKSGAIDKYIGDKYTQHNPYVADGKEALRAFVDSFPPRAEDAEPVGEIVRIIAENDLVVLHIKMKKHAMMDIFRVEKGKIVEHWDVMQAIPEKSANNNSMF